MKKQPFSVISMEEKTGIPRDVIRDALCLPPSRRRQDFSTFEKALATYEECAYDTEREQHALNALIKLVSNAKEGHRVFLLTHTGSNKELEAFMAWYHTIMTQQEAVACHSEVAPRNATFGGLIFSRWEEITEKEVGAANTIARIRIVHRDAPPETTSERIAFEKWNLLAQKRLEMAKTEKQTMSVYKSAPPRSSSERNALRKLATFYGWNG